MRNCRCRSNYYASQNNDSNNYNCYQRRNCCSNMTNQNNNTDTTGVFPVNYIYGHAYTPNQMMNETFTPQVGLENGSMFPELVSPYYPGQSMDFIDYLQNSNGNGGCGCE